MFQLKEIKEAHSKVKSGADFPKYVQELIKLGVTKYDTFVSNGHTLFVGTNNYHVQSEPKYSTLEVGNVGDA